jgi:xylulokinase
MALFEVQGPKAGTMVEGSLVKIPMSINENETDPAQWTEAFANGIRQIAGQCGHVQIATIAAILISGNGPTLVPVTASGAAMARHWLDRRAVEEGKTVSQLFGTFVDPSFFLPKILYIKNRESELYQKTEHFLSSSEYLAYYLSGNARMVLAGKTFEKWYWNDEVLDKAGFSGSEKDKFPAFIAPGEEIGEVLPELAGQFGLAQGVKVFAGGPDFLLSILGTGCAEPGDACDRSGTSEGINLCTEQYIDDKRLFSYEHPVKPFWNLSGIISTSGKAISWTRRLLGITPPEEYNKFYNLAAQAKAGGNGAIFLPYLAGERAPVWNPDAHAVFSGLSLHDSPAELARAACEGVCYSIRDVITVMEADGASVTAMRVTGGPSESDFLNQLKADVSGKPVLLPELEEAELLGLAVIGSVALGEYTNFGEAAKKMVRIKKVYTANVHTKSVYDDGFARYKELYKKLYL